MRPPKATRCTKIRAKKAHFTLCQRTRRVGGPTKKKGLGTWWNDRPPIFGTIGRTNGQIRLEVLNNTTQEEVEAALQEHRGETGACYSDESKAYYRVGTALLDHKTVCHSAKEWARDDDGDGIREVHTNTAEGLWTELRNFLRRFKRVSKHFIHLYVAMFEWMHNWKKISPAFMQATVFSKSET